MKIGIVGGLDRNESRYLRAGVEAGHEVEFHGGHVAGRGSAALEALVERCDLVIIVTDVNSHNAVQQARRLARQRNRRSLLLRNLGMSRFVALLRELGGAPAAQWAAAR